jgi:clan AA aspartic protease
MTKKSTSSEDALSSGRVYSKLPDSAREAALAAFTTKVSPRGESLIGEVRVKVKLTNAVDEAMVRRGLLSADQVRSYETIALVDTGAIRSVLPAHVVESLGLATLGKARAIYANDSGEDVDITEVVGIEINGRRTTEEALVFGSEVLIGQTVLESLDLWIDCMSRTVVGNPAHPDQPIIKIKTCFVSDVNGPGVSVC